MARIFKLIWSAQSFPDLTVAFDFVPNNRVNTLLGVQERAQSVAKNTTKGMVMIDCFFSVIVLMPKVSEA